ncbi:Fur-regulated basic protein FbpA [Bacillus sp. REN10]|uniref:Fur-regulated basic protein FbpA n=1 Tax=Bacillus sp. REN10 TaxID=2782541 RepID=UPI00193B4469|nr:Fur-regulated basic protein FbpA [Bacillus sp. REN10]
MGKFDDSKDYLIDWLLDRQVYKAKDGRQLFELSREELRHLIERVVTVRSS